MILRGKCSERLAGTEAYLPVLEALDNLLHAGMTGDSFAEMMRQAAPVWYLQVAPLSSESSTTQQMRDDARTASQERMKRELGVLLQEVSRVQPLVVLFEDLHWADVSTVDLLNYLGARLGTMRVLLLVTYRPSEMLLTQHPYLRIRQDLQGAGVLHELPLDFLTRDDVRRYLSLEFPEHRFPPEFEALVHAKTEGSPLFMVDLLRYLRDRGVVAEVQGRWALARSVPDIARDLPDSVRATIERKIERLDETSRKLLVTASVQGHEFDSAVVADVTGSDPADVEEALEALDRVHALVRRVHDQELPDRTLSVRYRFVHVLYQNVLYASLQPTRRASLSGKVAQSLVTHHGERDHAIASELAMLFEAARDARQAARWFFEAAQHAVGLIALREAVTLSRRGLAAVELVPEGPERDGFELGLQMILGFALRSVEGWAAPEVERIYTRARTLCERLGTPPQLFPAMWGLTLYHAIRGDLRVFLPLAEQLLAQATEAASPTFLVGAHQMLGSVHEFLGNTVTSDQHYDEALKLYDPNQTPLFTHTFGLDPGMISLSLSPRPLWFLGFADRAIARVEDTVALARRQRQPVSMVFAICLASNIRLLRGEAEASVRHADAEIALCREYGLAQELEWGRSFRGLARGPPRAGRRGDRRTARQPRDPAADQRRPAARDVPDLPRGGAGARGTHGRRARRDRGGVRARGPDARTFLRRRSLARARRPLRLRRQPAPRPRRPTAARWRDPPNRAPCRSNCGRRWAWRACCHGTAKATDGARRAVRRLLEVHRGLRHRRPRRGAGAARGIRRRDVGVGRTDQPLDTAPRDPAPPPPS